MKVTTILYSDDSIIKSILRAGDTDLIRRIVIKLNCVKARYTEETNHRNDEKTGKNISNSEKSKP